MLGVACSSQGYVSSYIQYMHINTSDSKIRMSTDEVSFHIHKKRGGGGGGSGNEILPSMIIINSLTCAA